MGCRQTYAHVILCLLLFFAVCNEGKAEAPEDTWGQCRLGLLQGRRSQMEDRAVCPQRLLTLREGDHLAKTPLHYYAVYDGHLGAGASSQAAQMVHTRFLERLQETSKSTLDLDQLSEAIKGAILDTDSDFLTKDDGSGTTACVALLAGLWLQVANVGDSRATLCSVPPPGTSCSSKTCNSAMSRKRRRKRASSGGRGGQCLLCAEELTEDHQPGHPRERQRIEAAGGTVENIGGVWRAQGQLMVSRAVGDSAFKRDGVIAEPELSQWRSLANTSGFLILASDGLHESLGDAPCVCDLLCQLLLNNGSLPSELDLAPPIALFPAGARPSAEAQRKLEAEAPKSLGKSRADEADLLQRLADGLISAAYARGSMDNIAVALVDIRKPPATSTAGANTASSTSSLKQEESISTEMHLEPLAAPVPAPTISNEDEGACHEVVVARGSHTESCYCLVELICSLPALPGGTGCSDSTTGRVNGVVTLQPYPVVTNANLDNMSRQVTKYLWPGLTLPFETDQWEGTTGLLDLYHEHLLGQFEGSLPALPKGLDAFLELIGSVPIHQPELPGKVRDPGQVISEQGDPGAAFVEEGGGSRYTLRQNFARGAFGEVWRAVEAGGVDDGSCSAEASGNPRACAKEKDTTEVFVLKRILSEKGTDVWLSGLREQHFGDLFKNVSLLAETRLPVPGASEQTADQARGGNEGYAHIARFVKSFETQRGRELWLVFRDEGHSLASYLYSHDPRHQDPRTAPPEPEKDPPRTPPSLNKAPRVGGGAEGAELVVVEPSAWWRWLKTEELGQVEMKSLLWQLLSAVKACHDRNITHRDIKPENMILQHKPGSAAAGTVGWRAASNLTVRLADFGSALDPHSLKHLYPPRGPSRAQQTLEYSPPEALFGKQHWLPRLPERATKYDLWSVGVVLLELVLGTPHVFQISPRTRALLNLRLRSWDASAKETAFLLRAFLELCIYPPSSATGEPPQGSASWVVSWACTEEAIMEQLRARDPIGVGVPNVWALRLLQRLLRWYPEQRITADEALHHAYFREGLPGGYRCQVCGKEFEFAKQCRSHVTAEHPQNASESDSERHMKHLEACND